MKSIESACLVIVTACLGYLLVEGGWFFRDARHDIDQLTAQSEETIQNANGVIDGAGQVETKLMDAADQQTAYWQKTQAQVYKLVTDTKEVMVRTDRSVNDVLVPRIAHSLDASTDVLTRAGGDVDRVSGDVDVQVSRAGNILEAVQADVSDPHIGETLIHIDAATDEIAGVAKDAHTETSLIVDRTREAFKPKNKFFAIVNGLTQGTLTLAELFFYLSH